VKIVDLNLLVYALNESAIHHKAARSWWEAALNGDETVGLPWVVILGFLRLSTNPSIFPRPLPVETAVARVNAWLSSGIVRLVREKDEHWEVLRSLVGVTGTAGNLTTDAHLAALAVCHGAVLVSFDHDFARFKGLRWENPLSA